jgi:hypothetical protein
MARLVVLRLYPRLVGAFGIVALAFLLVGLDPLLGAAPTSGSGAAGRTPAMSVNHFRKGDRLPLVHPGSLNSRTDQGVWRKPPMPDGLQTQERTPVGCDPAFSPVSSPARFVVYGRCIA